MTKIAIIEDDPVINQMYRMKFEADGFSVRVAENGEHGVALVEDYAPDIILLDLQMPHMNGAEALAKIRSETWGKDIPVLILTNLGEEEAPEELVVDETVVEDEAPVEDETVVDDAMEDEVVTTEG